MDLTVAFSYARSFFFFCSPAQQAMSTKNLLEEVKKQKAEADGQTAKPGRAPPPPIPTKKEEALDEGPCFATGLFGTSRRVTQKPPRGYGEMRYPSVVAS